MNVCRARLNKEKLLQIPDPERKLFITIAHLQNEIRFSLYGAVWSSDYSSDNEAIVHGQISLNFFYSKILAGKLYEGWKLLKNHYYGNRPLALDFNVNGSKEAISILKELKKYFGRENAIKEIRHNLSFHYSPDDLNKHLSELPDELDLYIAKENDANTLYYFAEALANRGVLSKLELSGDVNPLEAINSELIGIAKKFNKFNMLYMTYVLKKHSPEIWDGGVEEIKFENLMEFSKVRIPLFTDTTNGFV